MKDMAGKTKDMAGRHHVEVQRYGGKAKNGGNGKDTAGKAKIWRERFAGISKPVAGLKFQMRGTKEQ